MAFTPSPGTGDLIDIDPQFVDPANGDFSLQTGSPCIASGLDGYDRGAVWYVNRPQGVPILDIFITDSSTQAILNWNTPAMNLDSSLISGNVTGLIYRKDSLVAQIPGLSPGNTVQYTDSLPGPGYYKYTVSVSDTQGREGIRRETARSWGGGLLNGIVIWALDPNPLSKDALIQSLGELNYSKEIFVTGDPNTYDLTTDVEAVFVLLGIQPNDYLLGEGGSNRLITYLTNGGNVYLEGGDFWTDPGQQSLAVRQYFHIDTVDGGEADLEQVNGVTGTMMEGLHFTYSGENQSIDDITSQQDSRAIMKNPADGNGCAVAYNQYTYKTVGASFQFGGLDDGMYPNLKKEYLQRILNFFNSPTGIKSEHREKLVANHFILKQNYPNPFNSRTSIPFYSPWPGNVRLQVLNLLGQKLLEQSYGQVTAGWHTIRFNATGLNSGILFYRVGVDSQEESHQSVVHKMLYVK